MSPEEVLLAALVLVLIAVLAVLILRGGGGGLMRTSLEAGGLKWSLELSQEARVSVIAQLEAAVAKTGLAAGDTLAREHLASARSVQFGRILWVDDQPDNNIEETLMLMRLGLAVTQTASTIGARRYLSEAPFDLVITDLNRNGNPAAGLELLEQLAREDAAPPRLVYTIGAAERASRALRLGASAVLETPGELLAAVLARFGTQ